MNQTTITFNLNGREVTHSFAPYRTLLEVLRDDLSLTGSKEGCGTGDCGACTLLIDGKPVTSCLVLAGEADGREVTTVEGLATDGKLTPVPGTPFNTGENSIAGLVEGVITFPAPSCSRR